jgi:2-dehydropantoate 2-reductase
MVGRIAIVGAGAIGSAYGFFLARAGTPVVLIDTWLEHVEAITRDGLRVEGYDGPSPELRATTDAAHARDADAVLILVKARATEQAARSIAGVLAPGAIVVTLQNGIGNDARLAAVLGAERVVQGSTTVGAQVLGPGRIAVVPGTTDGRSLTSLGRPPASGPAAGCERLAAVLGAAGLPAQVLDDVSAVVWRKLVMAAAIGPLCATLGWDVAQVLDSELALTLLRRAFEEIIAVADAGGVALDGAELWSGAMATYGSIGPHPPSLAVDVAHGRPTEIESQLGEIQRRAARAGIGTPVSDLLAAVVRARDSV